MKAHVAASVLLSAATLCVCADQVTVDCPLRILVTGTNAAVFWQLPTECATNLTLQSAGEPSGPWTTIPGVAQPFVVANPATPQFFRTELLLPPGCPNASQMAQSIRTFAFTSKTNLNPATEFDIRIEPVRGLWDGLGVQVLIVRYLAAGEEFNRQACILHEATVRTVGQSTGGYGLMTGLVKGQSFYFTYSWGSGMHRSHLGKLRIVHGELTIWDSGGFLNQDLFLSRQADETIAVESGTFESFNGWLKSADFGRIDETDPAVTKVVGLDGSTLALFTLVNP